MQEKAVLAAKKVYDRLVAEADADGVKLTRQWVKVEQALADDPATAHLVDHLPGRLDRAILQPRQERLIQGRPPKYLERP